MNVYESWTKAFNDLDKVNAIITVVAAGLYGWFD